jgi:hypothetical protein
VEGSCEHGNELSGSLKCWEVNLRVLTALVHSSLNPDSQICASSTVSKNIVSVEVLWIQQDILY